MQRHEFLSFIESECIAASVAAAACAHNDDRRIRLLSAARRSWAVMAWHAAQRRTDLSLEDWVGVLRRVRARSAPEDFATALKQDIVVRLRAAGVAAEEVCRRLAASE